MKGLSIVKNISYTFIANAIALVVSLFSTLILPKMTSELDFGYWQLYVLYMSYAGLFHLGLCDGIYLKYGGKIYDSLDKRLIRDQLLFLSGFVAILEVIVALVLFFNENNSQKKVVIILFCLGAFAHVIKTFFLLILQATDQIKKYANITILDRIVFVILLILFLFEGQNTYIFIIWADIIGRWISLGLSALEFKDILKKEKYFKADVWSEIRDNIKIGLPLLISGIAANFIVGVIRLGIENGWDIVIFGKVSLSLSIVNMILSFVTMIGIVFFPVLKKIQYQHYAFVFKNLNIIVVLFALGCLIFAIPVQKIIRIWLPDYSFSMQIMVWIMPICVFESEMSILLNTYMKALRKEKIILLINFSIMVFSMIYAYVFTSYYPNLYVAIAGIVIFLGIKALFTKIYVISKLKIKNEFNLYVEFLVTPLYVFAVTTLSGWHSMFLYLLIYILLIAWLKKDILNIIRFGTDVLRR